MEGETPEEFRERMRSIGFMSRGRTRTVVKNTRDENGVKTVKRDELGSDVINRTDEKGREVQDVRINAPRIVQRTTQEEVRT